MRNIERIPIVMNLMFGSTPRIRGSFPIYHFIENINPTITNHRFDIMYYWMNNPDQRLGQVLYNLGLIDDSKYNVEEDD